MMESEHPDEQWSNPSTCPNSWFSVSRRTGALPSPEIWVSSTVTVAFSALAAGWPRDAEMLSVNPDTPLAFTMPAEIIEAFATPLPRDAP